MVLLVDQRKGEAAEPSPSRETDRRPKDFPKSCVAQEFCRLRMGHGQRKVFRYIFDDCLFILKREERIVTSLSISVKVKVYDANVNWRAL